MAPLNRPVHGRPGLDPVVTGPAEHPAVDLLGALVVVRLGGANTGGRWTVLEHRAPRGHRWPRHLHAADDTTVMLQQGTVLLHLADDEQVLGPGAVAVIPRGVPHGLLVTSSTAVLLSLHSPAGLEALVGAVGRPVDSPDGPPHPDLEALARRHGIMPRPLSGEPARPAAGEPD